LYIRVYETGQFSKRGTSTLNSLCINCFSKSQ
jgi:hypothetical protein